MAKRPPLTADEATELFSELDDSGVVDPMRARDASRRRAARDRAREEGGDEAVSKLESDHRRRRRASQAKVDPLSTDDPSGSKVGEAITRTAMLCIIGVLVFVLGMQIVYGVSRRLNTANLSERTTVETVTHAMESGVEWGNGFTQFPSDFSVQEADENTGRIEVTVIDTSSENALECFSGSQVQATAFAVNAMLNPNIDTVVYHVNVHVGEDGKMQRSSLFGFLKPTGDVSSFMTFVWTKTQSESGVNFSCRITGIDAVVQEELRDQITTSFTPVQILSSSE